MADPSSVDDLDAGQVLRGEVEASRLPASFSRDHPVPRFGYNLLNQFGKLYRPIFDERRIEQGHEPPEWPDGSPFAVCLTHDIDTIQAASVTKPLRQGILRARHRIDAIGSDGPVVPKAGIDEAILAMVGGIWRSIGNVPRLRTEPPPQLDPWIDIEEEVGAQSTLFVPPERASETHVSDPMVGYDDTIMFQGETRRFSSVLRELDQRGYEIGLHPTWYAFDDPEELRFQKQQLEAAIGNSVRTVRQHWLHYDICSTPRAHAEAGFQYDSTLGVTGNVGFRFGTSYPWKLHDLESGIDVDVFEIPLIAQDTALFDEKHMHLDEGLATTYVEALADAVEAVGGVLTLNWHPEFTASGQRLAAYAQIVEELASRNPWFGTVGQIGDYWREAYGNLHS